MVNTEIGVLEVICGPMFSGKSDELIRRLNIVPFGNQKFLAFKPVPDTRSGVGIIATRNGLKIEATEIHPDKAFDVTDKIKSFEAEYGRCQVIGLDEGQFFDRGSLMINVLKLLLRQGRRVIVSGLDMDRFGEPFGMMPDVLALADKVTKLKAACAKCGSYHARYTQKIFTEKSLSVDSSIILVGDENDYEARCRACFKFPEPRLETSPRAIARSTKQTA